MFHLIKIKKKIESVEGLEVEFRCNEKNRLWGEKENNLMHF